MPRSFRIALLVSVILHASLIIFVAASPSLSRSPNKGLVQYVNFLGPGGGPGGGGPGGGGSASVVAAPLPPAKAKASLRDLTVASKVKAEDKAGLRHPVDKPKPKPGKKAPEKKASIAKGDQAAAAEEKSAAGAAGGQEGGTGSGFGLRFGTGGGPGGGGTGPGGLGGGGGDPYGVSGFPFNYYLQIISDRITTNWFSSLVDPGTGGQLQTQVGFRIYRNGQVSDVKIEFSSGAEAFDLSAQRAVQSSAPFPPLPSEYDGQFLVIHLIFEHAKQT